MSTHTVRIDQRGQTWTGQEADGAGEDEHPLRRMRTILERHAHLSSTQRITLMAIAFFVDQRGVAWPARARLERITGLSERSLRSAVRALERTSVVTTILPWQDRRMVYQRTDGVDIAVPDGVCVYFVWAMAVRRLDAEARRLAIKWDHIQQQRHGLDTRQHRAPEARAFENDRRQMKMYR